MIGRRSFIAGILGAAAAPAIVRAESLMKIVVPKREILVPLEIGVIERFRIVVSPVLADQFADAYRQALLRGTSGLSLLLAADGQIHAKNMDLLKLSDYGIHLIGNHQRRPT